MRIRWKPAVALLAIGIVFPVAWSAVFDNNETCACSKNSEDAVIQTAMHAIMADKGITEVAASPYSVQDWTSYPIVPGPDLLPLTDYLGQATTEYFYCWDTTGWITQQEESGPVRCSQQ